MKAMIPHILWKAPACLLFLIISFPAATHAQWEALGPGAGGQIQGLHFSPNDSGRAYFFMDVEGSYRTTDFGQSWFHMTGNNLNYYNAELQEKPGDANRLYMGTFWGLLISDNGGGNWSLTGSEADQTTVAFEIRNQVIGTVAVDTRLPNAVYCAPEWRVRNVEFNVMTINPQNGTGEFMIYYSFDNGNTWYKSIYETGTGWNPVYSISPDPDNELVLWIATYQGLYRGERSNASDTTFDWTRISGPALAENGTLTPSSGQPDGNRSNFAYTYGAAIAPGGYIYACWNIDEPDTPGSAYADSVNNEKVALSMPYVAKLSDLENNPNGGDANWVPLMRSENKGMLFVSDIDTVYGNDISTTSTDLGRNRRNGGNNYWRPKVDPRSTPTEHKVMIGELFLTNQSNVVGGLYEAKFSYPTANASAATGEWVRIFSASGTDNNRGGFNPAAVDFDYDFGWQNLSSRARHFYYSPTNWTRKIWVGNDQNLYEIDTLSFSESYSQDITVGEKYHTDWKPVMTSHVSTIAGKKTFINRGITSTVDYDSDSDGGNYLIFSGADNMLYESYDAGGSFIMSEAMGLGQGDAVVVTPPVPEAGNERFVVLAGIRNVFGGGLDFQGDELAAKKLVNGDPSDEWIRIAGSTDANCDFGLAGFRRRYDASEPAYSNPTQPPRVIDMAADPTNPNQIYLSTVFGVFVITDLNGVYEEMKAQIDAGANPNRELLASKDWVVKIYDNGTSNPVNDTLYRRLFFDNDDPNVFYFATRQRVVKATRPNSSSLNWSYEDIYTTTNSATNVNDFYYWSHNGDDYFVIGAPDASGDVRVRKNDGAWNVVWVRDTQYRSTAVFDDWLENLSTHFSATEGNQDKVLDKIQVASVAGYQDQVFVSTTTKHFRRGIMFRGQLNANATSANWEDWTGDDYNYPDGDFLYHAWMRRMNVIDQNGAIYLYGSGQGPGSWRRLISGNVTPTVAAPASVTATEASSTSITVSWSNVAAATSYDVQQLIAGGSWQTIQDDYTSGTSLNVTGLQEDNTYSYRVRSNDATTTSGYTTSNSVTLESSNGGGNPGTTKPDAPTSVTVAVSSDTSVTISWAASAGATEYDIQRQGADGVWRAVQNGFTGGTTIEATGLITGDSYTFRVKARNSIGASGWTLSDAIVVEDVPPPPPPPTSKPDAPASVSASSLTDTSAEITWTASEGASEYDIQRQGSDGVWRAVQNGYTGGTTIDSTGLTSGGTYTFRVKARNSFGASGWTLSATITLDGSSGGNNGGGNNGGGTGGDPTVKPDAPASVSSSQATSTSATITWAASDGADEYDIHHRGADGVWRAVQNGYTGGTSVTKDGLTTGDSYDFRVKARNAIGASAWTETTVALTL